MNKKALAVGGLVALLLIAGIGYYAYEIIDTDAPESVSTESALDQITADLEPDETEVEEASEETVEDDASDADDTQTLTAGTWIVDDEFGEFDFESASGSFAGFRVDKAFFSGIDAVAVGRTGDVTGTVTIGDSELSAADITVDMTTIVSDDSGREDAIQDAIKSSEFPTATFAVATPVALDTDALAAGETVTVNVTGALTIAGVANDVVVPIEATIVEDGFGVIIGSTDIVWADYGVETPESSVADVADEGTLEFQLIVALS